MKFQLLVFIASQASAHLPVQQPINIHNDATVTDTIHDKLISSEIIPQVLDDFIPTYNIAPLYPDHEEIRFGNIIPVDHVAHRPIFTITKLAITEEPEPSNKVFTVILTDPDATSRDNPKWSEMCHWILTNVTKPSQTNNPGIFLPNGITTTPTELVKYLAPSPPKKTGLHRYVFVILEGDANSRITAPTTRKHWGYKKVRHGVRDWAQENGLTVVGANWFEVQNKKQ